MKAVLRDYGVIWRAALSIAPARAYKLMGALALFLGLFVACISYLNDAAVPAVLLNGLRAGAGLLQNQTCICLLFLPLIGASLRDQARHSGENGIWSLIVVLLGAGLCLLLAFLIELSFGLPLLPVAACAAVLLTIISVRWRWQRMVSAPHAFPVGRLA